MSILRVKSLVATAEIAGLVREIGYDDATKRLYIEALNADEALELLKYMGRASQHLTMGMASNEAALVDILSKQSEEASTEVEPATKREPAQKNKPKKETTKEKTEKKPAPAKKRTAAKKKTEYVDPPTQPEPSIETSNIQDDIEEVSDEPFEPEPTEVEVPKQEGVLSQELLSAKKLRDIVSILFDEGYKTPEDVVERCHEISAQLPIIKRLKNLNERVARAMDVMGMIE